MKARFCTRTGCRYYLYTRANVKRSGGGRFLQVAVSAEDHPASPYGPFALLSIRGYDERGPSNVYFATVKPFPLDESMLLGLFAVNLGNATIEEQRSKQRSSVALQRRQESASTRSLSCRSSGAGDTTGRFC